MGVMTAADLMALAEEDDGPEGLINDPTRKHSASQRKLRRKAQQARPRLVPKPEPSSPVVKAEPIVEDEPGAYKDYTIYSKATDGDIYCLMRFKAPNPNDEIDIKTMPAPFRLNRKNPKAKAAAGDSSSDPLALKEPKWHPLRGPDGREIIGKDGKVVMGAMVDGREILQVNWGKEKEKMSKAELEAKKKKAPFKKKTRQVFTANPESKSDPQERFPWVFESAGDRDSWTGRKQNFDDGSAYGILAAVPGRPDAMSFIPLTTRYDFVMTKTHAASKTAEAAEAELADIMKRGSLMYQMNRRANGGASAATLATITAEGSSASGSGPRVKKEEDDDGGGLFGSDDEGPRRGEKGDGGDVDEMDFEEEHADDEDNVEPEEMEDEDTKASKARIKREQIAANKTVDGGVDDDEDEDDETLTKEGRRMKRALMKQDTTYDSDDEESHNPYASSEEDDDDDGFLFRPVPEAPAAKPATPPSSNASGSRSNTPKPRAGSKGPGGASSSKEVKKEPSGSTLKVPASASRGASPIPNLSGSAVLAQRATSPPPKKGSRGSTPSAGRASSPLAGNAGSRAGSPAAAAASSLGGSGSGRPASLPPRPGSSTPASAPAAGKVKKPVGMPGSGTGSPLKRKAMDDGAHEGPSISASSSTTLGASPTKEPTKKKVKKSNIPNASNAARAPNTSATGAGPSSPAPTNAIPETFPGMITEAEVLRVLSEHPQGINSSTLIQMFKKHFTDEPRNKKVLSTIVKRVATSAPIPGSNSYLLSTKPGYV